MRLKIHYAISKIIYAELWETGINIKEISFLFGNIFPDLIFSFLWRRHEYKHSKDHFKKMLDEIKNKSSFISFKLGVITHYISDYFCYSHMAIFNKGLISHIFYEMQQKIPIKLLKFDLPIINISIEELDSYVNWYESFREFTNDDESDCQIAATLALNFIVAEFSKNPYRFT